MIEEQPNHKQEHNTYMVLICIMALSVMKLEFNPLFVAVLVIPFYIV
jgi:hypothetical protein